MFINHILYIYNGIELTAKFLIIVKNVLKYTYSYTNTYTNTHTQKLRSHKLAYSLGIKYIQIDYPHPKKHNTKQNMKITQLL